MVVRKIGLLDSKYSYAIRAIYQGKVERMWVHCYDFWICSILSKDWWTKVDISISTIGCMVETYCAVAYEMHPAMFVCVTENLKHIFSRLIIVQGPTAQFWWFQREISLWGFFMCGQGGMYGMIKGGTGHELWPTYAFNPIAFEAGTNPP
ncbi:hypothetical protein O181_024245 [Austropuccinia psidii MF-1]|uniref:Uncharacterized protein n=1 Tax=Austropuccinia psidii MF-1 TaxID=1389203 RepID=A0A9Q3CKL9_9BASI|nr:hypothetical protein [Austropuccinia psidii MF-1]